MRPLSPRQHKVYERLREHHRRTGALPDLSELARGLGITYVTLKQHLEALAHKGYLTFEGRGRGRSPIVTLPAAATGVPLLGSIPAGPLSEAVADAEGFLPLPGLDERHFALRVRGDSMADLIQAGDVVLLERTPPVRDGLICAVRVSGDDVTLKYLEREGRDRFRLRAHNPDYPDLRVAAADVQVDGVYRGLLRGEVLDVLLHG
ncbi:MAG: LexA family transcriptional regulator, partial [Trueperaceae bacterium]